MKMPKPWPLAGLHEPDRRLDHLLDLLNTEDDPDLDRWAVDALAGGRGLAVVLVEGNELEQATEFGEMFQVTLTTAGIDQTRRDDLSRLVVRHIEELKELLRRWKLERAWFALEDDTVDRAASPPRHS